MVETILDPLFNNTTAFLLLMIGIGMAFSALSSRGSFIGLGAYLSLGYIVTTSTVFIFDTIMLVLTVLLIGMLGFHLYQFTMSNTEE